MRRPALAVALALLTAAPAIAKEPPVVRVRITTGAGAFVVALDTRRAPRTSANFLAYVDDGRFDGVTFYRVARQRTAPRFGFIQGGIRTDASRILPPFAQEPTSLTGLRHTDGTISMARRADPRSAGGNFFITVGAMPSMDASATSPGYAAFGHVVSGMDVVRHILAQPTGAGTGMAGQTLVRPIRLVSAKRLNGAPHPTGRVKPWLEVKR
jgi:peptidyl-prolyl cis-trans isomerase A (cyclophilin A)